MVAVRQCEPGLPLNSSGWKILLAGIVLIL